VSGFELDCAITADGVVVIYHDALLNPEITRGPDGKWLEGAGAAISTLSLAELGRYDVGRIRPGSEYAARFPDQAPVDGARIPRLAQLFSLAREAGNESLRFYLELKLSPLRPERTAAPAEFARSVIAVLRESGMAPRAAILSFDWRALAAAQREAPDIPTVYLSAQQSWQDNILARATSSPWTAPLHVGRFGGSLPRTIRAAGGSAWAPFYEELTGSEIEEAHALGLKVVAWTVNEPAAMRRMIALGVDAIISDYPDRLRQVALEAGAALPEPTPVRS
jgi:glycerophosphoryl diester phosphodiesterase